MKIDAKLQDPIIIKLGKEMLILADKNNPNLSLKPGAIIGGEHYGFILITEVNGTQKEYVYPTQCRVDAVGIENNCLKVFEDGKRLPWRITKKGKIEHSPIDDFTTEFKIKHKPILDNPDLFLNEPIFKNPIRIKISIDPSKSVILKDDFISQDYPLHPGVMLGTEHYGFIIITEKNGVQKETLYQTQNPIAILGIEGDIMEDLKIFEHGKYHPWLFTYSGNFKSKAAYNPYSKRDTQYLEENYNIDNPDTDCFNLTKKK